jgi:hypothetical protein
LSALWNPDKRFFGQASTARYWVDFVLKLPLIYPTNAYLGVENPRSRPRLVWRLLTRHMMGGWDAWRDSFSWSDVEVRRPMCWK